MNEFKPLTQVELDDLLEGIEKTKANISAKSIARLDHKGFSIVQGGDLTLSRLQKELKYISIKPYDNETWYIIRNGYSLTKEDHDYIKQNCRY